MARSRSCHLQCVEKWQDPDLATYYGLKNGKIRILPLTKSLKTPDPMGSGKIRISPSDFNRYVEYGIMKGGKIQVILFCFFKVARSRSCHFFCLKVARSMARIIFKLSPYSLNMDLARDLAIFTQKKWQDLGSCPKSCHFTLRNMARSRSCQSFTH